MKTTSKLDEDPCKEQRGLPHSKALRVFIAVYDESCFDFALEVTRGIRDLEARSGSGHGHKPLVAHVALAKQSFKRQFQTANDMGATHVVVIGPDEVSARGGKLKDLATGEERTLALDDLLSTLRGLLAS